MSDRIVPAQHMLKQYFTPASEGGVTKLIELARILGSNRAGKITPRQQEILSEACAIANALKSELYSGLRPNEDRKSLTVFLAPIASFPNGECARHFNFCADKQGVLRSPNSYFANRENVIRAMELYLKPLINGAGHPEIEESIGVYGHFIHKGLLSEAAAKGFDIFYKPLRKEDLSLLAVGRAKGRGYGIHAILFNASLDETIDDARSRFQAGEYAYKSWAALEKKIRRDFGAFRTKSMPYLEYADDIKVIALGSKGKVVTALSCDAGGSWIQLDNDAASDFFLGNDFGFTIEDIAPRGKAGIPPAEYARTFAMR